MQTDDKPSFNEGETIYDLDGNAYTVRDNSAVLNVENTRVSYFLDPGMAPCFSRSNPKAA